MKKFFPLFIFIFLVFRAESQTELIIQKDEKGLYLEHTVVAKEGLYSIGRLYNVNPRHIAAYNNMDLNEGIDVDQVLKIPLTDTNFTQRTPSGTPVYYKIMQGEGLYRISVENNKVPVKSLREWNDLSSDNINEGENLIVGFLISKEMVARMANNRAKMAQENLAKTPVPVPEKPVAGNNPEPPVVPATRQETATDRVKEELPQVQPAVVKEEVKPAAKGSGYFRGSFEQQVKKQPVSKNVTVTSGIFKTTSGWQDAKYYALMDNVSPGTIIRIINPENNKTIYAKVLGEMNGIRQNKGLDVRISNAAAAELQVSDQDKFVLTVNY